MTIIKCDWLRLMYIVQAPMCSSPAWNAAAIGYRTIATTRHRAGTPVRAGSFRALPRGLATPAGTVLLLHALPEAPDDITGAVAPGNITGNMNSRMSGWSTVPVVLSASMQPAPAG